MPLRATRPHARSRGPAARCAAPVSALLALVLSALLLPGTGDAQSPVECAELLARAWEQAPADAAPADPVPRRCQALAAPGELDFLEARRALFAGDLEAAAAAIARAERSGGARLGDRPHEADITYLRGLIADARGDFGAAERAYRELADEHPADARVAVVLPRLDEHLATSPQERIDAAVEAVDHHNYTGAERLLSQVVRTSVGVEATDPGFEAAARDAIEAGPAYVGEAVYQLAYLWHYWIRVHNPRSVPMFAAIAATDHARRADAAYYLARAHMRAEDYPAALAAWADFAERFPRDDRVHEATYYRGWLHLDREEFEEALPGLREYVARYPDGARYDRARWYVGWALFRLGRFEEAREHFADMGRRGGYLDGAKARYWEARSLRELGREGEAVAVFERLAEDYAFTYYGLLANVALGRPALPPREHEPPPLPSALLERLAADDADLAALRGLLAQGEPYRATRFYEAEHPERAVRDTLERTLVEQAAGDAYAAFRDAGRTGSRLRTAPTDRTMLEWLHTFPRPFDTFALAAEQELGTDPLLAWSHMQIESHYHPGLVSYADAQGLLQLIQRTGQNVSEALDEPYTEGMLMNPAVNVRYGMWYLGALVEEFGGQLPLAMCSYNAGAHSMHRWVEENADLPFDAFVEEIPYDQSREYVKRAIGVYAHYLYFYANDAHLADTMPRLVPTHIDASLVRGVLDY